MSRHTSTGTEWAKLRQATLERDLFQCQLRYAGCQQVATEADHTIPKSRGGPDSLDNLRAACRRCNGRKQNRMFVRSRYLNTRYFPQGVRDL